MNLNNLKPAWQQYRLLNSMQSVEKEEILFMIEQAEDMSINKLHRFFTNTAMFMLLTICIQGG